MKKKNKSTRHKRIVAFEYNNNNKETPTRDSSLKYNTGRYRLHRHSISLCNESEINTSHRCPGRQHLSHKINCLLLCTTPCHEIYSGS